jgi:ATP-binding cassette subfamily B protein
MRILWTYLRPYRWLILLSLVLAGAAQLLSLVDPIIFGKIIDGYAFSKVQRTERELVSGVLRLLGLAVAVALLSRFARTMQDYVVNFVVQKFGMQIFNDGIRQTLRLSYAEFMTQRSGETLSVLQSVRTDTERFINAFINILFSSLVGVGFLVWYAVTKSWTLVPVFLVGIAGLGGLTGLLSSRIKTLQRSIKRETNRMSGVITEALRNIELVKSLGLTFQEIRRLRAHTQEIFDLELAKVRKVRTLTFLQGSALTLLRQSILFILLWLIFRKVLAPGELIAMQFITAQIFMPLQDLGNVMIPIARRTPRSRRTTRCCAGRSRRIPRSRWRRGRSPICGSTTWYSATPTRRPTRSTTSRSRRRPATRSPSSGRPGPASRRWSSCSSGSIGRWRERSSTTASRRRTSASIRCGAGSAS